MSWVQVIIEHITSLFPWRRVQPYQRGVRTCFVPWKGVRVSLLQPGIARCIPWFDSVEIRDIQEDSYNLPTQSVTTKDDVAVTFSANFTFEIEDVKASIFNVREFATSLQDLAMLHLSERVRDLTWAELRDGQKKLEKSIEGTLTTRAKDWGVRIQRFGLTDMVKARQFRHFGEITSM
jgi:regulator of protease activity HflC (stomatin/prohibitin superfamily)